MKELMLYFEQSCRHCDCRLPYRVQSVLSLPWNLNMLSGTFLGIGQSGNVVIKSGICIQCRCVVVLLSVLWTRPNDNSITTWVIDSFSQGHGWFILIFALRELNYMWQLICRRYTALMVTQWWQCIQRRLIVQQVFTLFLCQIPLTKVCRWNSCVLWVLQGS